MMRYLGGLTLAYVFKMRCLYLLLTLLFHLNSFLIELERTQPLFAQETKLEYKAFL